MATDRPTGPGPGIDPRHPPTTLAEAFAQLRRKHPEQWVFGADPLTRLRGDWLMELIDEVCHTLDARLPALEAFHAGPGPGVAATTVSTVVVSAVLELATAQAQAMVLAVEDGRAVDPAKVRALGADLRMVTEQLHGFLTAMRVVLPLSRLLAGVLDAEGGM